jgi:2-polyprenyl-3-methyl-5-hydroxy-6-metoxy-1,4-benzoquinol methylase
VCGDVGQLRFRLRDYDVCGCPSCKTEFNASFTGGGLDGELFSRDYFEVQHKEAFKAQFLDYRQDPSLPIFVRRLAQIEGRIGIGRVLDIGPGLGTFLHVARDRGWEAEGVEVSRFAADFIRSTHGLPVFAGDLTEFEQHAGRTFDVVTFWDSIEHVARPVEVLRSARRLLREGGLLVIATDNFDCLIASITAALYRVTAGRVRYPVERVFIDRNRTYFTQRSLQAVLVQLGLRVVYSEKMEYPLEKIRTNALERTVLAAMYAAAHATGRQAQLTVFAEPS